MNNNKKREERKEVSVCTHGVCACTCLKNDICVPKNHRSVKNRAMKTTGLTVKMGLRA